MKRDIAKAEAEIHKVFDSPHLDHRLLGICIKLLKAIKKMEREIEKLKRKGE